MPNPSPFCGKVETYLRLAGHAYEVKTTPSPIGTPKGKLPLLIDGAHTIADSGMILQYLKNKMGDPLDAHLDAPTRGAAHAVRRMVEEHLYFVIVWVRWIDRGGWRHTNEALFGAMPAGFRHVAPNVLRRRVRQQLQAQGVGRHTPDEIFDLGVRDVAALGEFLGDKPFMLGERPRSLDATCYAFLASILGGFDSPLAEAVRSWPNLVAYEAQMQADLFPELATDGTAPS